MPNTQGDETAAGEPPPQRHGIWRLGARRRDERADKLTLKVSGTGQRQARMGVEPKSTLESCT